MNEIVAMSDGNCIVDNPIIACPDVQPPAYRVPKPTRNPPKTIMIIPFTDKRVLQLNSSGGISSLKLLIPYCCNSTARSASTLVGCGLAKKCDAKNAPHIIPVAKNKFHTSFFQSYLKNRILDGRTTAQIWRREEDTPKLLLPITSSNGTVNPISGPAIYQGHGCFSHSIIFMR